VNRRWTRLGWCDRIGGNGVGTWVDLEGLLPTDHRARIEAANAFIREVYLPEQRPLCGRAGRRGLFHGPRRIGRYDQNGALKDSHDEKRAA
jgi:hypothetical protein